MPNFPYVGVHVLLWFVVQLKLGKKVFVLFSILQVELKKVHGRFNDNPILLQQLLQLIQRNQPLLNILNLPSFRVLLTDSLFQIKLINVPKRLGKLSILKPNRKILVTINCRTIFLFDSFLVDFFQDGVAVRDGGYEDAVYE